MGITVKALIGVIIALNTQIAALEEEISESFDQHPDATIVRSLPGLATVLGARVLAEFGDDPNRYDNAKSRKDYAGTSPITRASSNSRVVLEVDRPNRQERRRKGKTELVDAIEAARTAFTDRRPVDLEFLWCRASAGVLACQTCLGRCRATS